MSRRANWFIARLALRLTLVSAVFVFPCAAAGAASVHDSEYVSCDGAKLYLLVRGADSTAPLLLWLHGGPGGAERPLFRYFNSELERHFVVVYWDQRGAGRSFDPEADPRRLTIARHVADLACVVDHLRHRLRREKVILIGHSWGAALGLLYARAHPDAVSAFIGVNPVVSVQAQQKAEYDFVLTQATQHGDADVLKRLREIGKPPFETSRKEFAMEKLDQRYGGIYHKLPNRLWVMFRAIVTALVTPLEIRQIIRGNNVSLEAMNSELLGLDLTRSVPIVDVPVLFFLGRYGMGQDFLIEIITEER